MDTFNDAWRNLGQSLARFASRRRADPAAADDIAQETLARTLAAFGPVHVDSGITRWAFRTARNLIIDGHRRRHPLSSALASSSAAATDTESAPGIAGVAPCLAEMVTQLEPAYRQAVLLVDAEGMTQQAVADRLGLSVSGVKSRVQRGRSRLRGMLLDCCTIELDRRRNVTAFRTTERSSWYCGGRPPERDSESCVHPGGTALTGARA